MLNISENESKLPNLDKYQNLESIGDIYFFYPLADFIMPFFHDILKLKPNHITTIGFLSRLFSSYMILYKKLILKILCCTLSFVNFISIISNLIW